MQGLRAAGHQNTLLTWLTGPFSAGTFLGGKEQTYVQPLLHPGPVTDALGKKMSRSLPALRVDHGEDMKGSVRSRKS